MVCEVFGTVVTLRPWRPHHPLVSLNKRGGTTQLEPNQTLVLGVTPFLIVNSGTTMVFQIVIPSVKGLLGDRGRAVSQPLERSPARWLAAAR